MQMVRRFLDYAVRDTFWPSLRRQVGIGLLCLAAASGLAAAERTFKAYPLVRPPSEETLQAFKDLVGDRGNVTYDRSGLRLFVSAEPATHSNLVAFIRDVDRVGRNVRIEVTMRETGRSRASGIGLGGAGGLVVSGGNATVVGSVALNAHNTSSRTSGMTQQTLVTMEGGSASLTVGEDVPFYEQWLVQWGYNYGYWQQQVTVQRVGASLVIEPLVSADGKLVTVKLVPTVSALVDGQPQRIKLTQVATEVTVANGGTITLGGLNEHRDFYNRFLVGVDAGGQTRTLDIKMTPTVMEAFKP
jgi:type II secretory pathway component GspD/PulD (secretin)